MSWDDLAVFLAVARRRSHAGAGRELRVDATTVGRRIAALEGGLGARLFHRTPEGLVPTDAGARLLVHAERVELEILAARRALEGADASLSGPVRLTASDGLVDYVLLPSLVELRRAHPEIEWVVRADAQMLDLSRREADVAVRLVRPKEPTLVARRIGTMHFGVFASRDASIARPRGLAALAGQGFVGFDADLDDVPQMRWLKRHVPGIHFVVRTNTTAAQVRACLAGHGIALLPRFVAPHEPGLVELLPKIEGPTREIWAVAHRDVRRSPRVALLFDWLARTMARTRGVSGPD